MIAAGLVALAYLLGFGTPWLVGAVEDWRDRRRFWREECCAPRPRDGRNLVPLDRCECGKWRPSNVGHGGTPLAQGSSEDRPAVQ